MMLEKNSTERCKYSHHIVYRQNYRARRRGLRAELQGNDWIRCLRAWGERCCFCGRYAEQTLLPLTADHFIALNWPNSPASTIYNIVPACTRCNHLKGDLHPVIWLLWQYGEAGAIARMERIQRYFNSL